MVESITFKKLGLNSNQLGLRSTINKITKTFYKC